MSKRVIFRFMAQACKGAILICFFTYLLRQVDERFLGIFAAAAVILIWLVAATVVLFLERLLYGDEG